MQALPIEILLTKHEETWELEIPEIGFSISGKYLMDVLEEAAEFLEELTDTSPDD